MARLVSCLLLILLIPGAAAITDAEGDPSQRVGSRPVDAPAIDLRNVTATLASGELTMRIETWGDLLIGDQSAAMANRTYTYLFIVAVDTSPQANLYDHISVGGPSITAVCTYSEGRFDLSCEVTQGDATLRGSGAVGRNVTARFAVPFDGEYAIGASSHMSIPNGTGREILAQDFTDNALPYQGLPAGGETPPVLQPAGSKAWYQAPWVWFALAGVAVFVIGMVVPWEWFKPSHWRRP